MLADMSAISAVELQEYREVRGIRQNVAVAVGEDHARRGECAYCGE